MPSSLQIRGKRGEQIAKRFLEKLGYRCLEEQWHSRYGEIDLVMLDGDELVFVEVKLRKNNDYGYPEDMLSSQKRQRLLKTALKFVSQSPIERFWRFDTVAITLKGDHHELAHFKDTIRIDS